YDVALEPEWIWPDFDHRRSPNGVDFTLPDNLWDWWRIDCGWCYSDVRYRGTTSGHLTRFLNRGWCLQRASAKAPQKNIAPSTAANQAGGPLSGGPLKMLI